MNKNSTLLLSDGRIDIAQSILVEKNNNARIIPRKLWRDEYSTPGLA
jgi:hypothetical protein